MIRRDYQSACVAHAVQRLQGGHRATCYHAPTGTGKSIIALDIQHARRASGRACWIVTPRVEIISGMLDKLGIAHTNAAKTGSEHMITTPVRLRNMLARNELGQLPQELIIDEAHHGTASTYEELRLASTRCQLIGLTATPYRGSPRATLDFTALWGDSWEVLSLDDSIAQGYSACPEFRVVPLLDDDQINIVGGEFQVTSIEDAMLTRIDALADLINSIELDRPTIVSLPSTEIVKQLLHMVPNGIAVTQATTAKQRKAAFAAVLAGDKIMLQIDVVSEGVDLPLRRLIDARPTFSPVKWMQQLGRITRPNGQSEYICTNRNVERHGYLWAGVLPRKAIIDAVSAFPTQSIRAAGARVIGLERIGKFRPVEIPLANGLSGSMFAWQVVEPSGVVREFIAFATPTAPDPFYATRIRGNQDDGYGEWRAIATIPDMEGATTRSMPSGKLTPKMAAWWERDAVRVGLDSKAEVNRKQFALLPILRNCGVKLDG